MKRKPGTVSSGPRVPYTKCAPKCLVSASANITMSPRATDRLRHIASPLPRAIPYSGSSSFSEYTSAPHRRAIPLVPSVESASTTMTWSTRLLRRFRRAS
ncbi:MAG TPA: hypothetical protein VGR98_17830 [Streptosporangiaceae bacterium]|nr:hypothetical protein [Streptosporangiaceae bacterium]